jgi:hypothetical protein
MTEPASETTARTPRSRRVPVLGILVGILLIVALAVLWVRVSDPFNPYRPGTTHTATIVNHVPECLDAWFVDLHSGSHHYRWKGSAPEGWDPQGVTGTLHILHNWGASGTDAIFEADGQKVNLDGGRVDDGKHAWPASCAVR